VQGVGQNYDEVMLLHCSPKTKTQPSPQGTFPPE
jgi:hypothetical protein